MAYLLLCDAKMPVTAGFQYKTEQMCKVSKCAWHSSPVGCNCIPCIIR